MAKGNGIDDGGEPTSQDTENNHRTQNHLMLQWLSSRRLVTDSPFLNQAHTNTRDGLSINLDELRLLYGYTHTLSKELVLLASRGIILSIRAKPWGLRESVRHEDSSAKPMTMKAKTFPWQALSRGHLSIEATPEKDNFKVEKIEHDNQIELYQASWFDNIEKIDCKQYVTFERQSVEYIEAQIASKSYKVLDHGVHNDGTPWRVIQDQADKCHFVNYNDFKTTTLVTGRETPVRKMSKLLNSTRMLQQLFPPLTSLIDDHKGETVKILRCTWDNNKKEWSINQEPHIACDENAKPIKGDADQQNVMLPNNLPLAAYQYITAKTPQELANSLKNLNTNLRNQSGPHFVTYSKIITAAIAELESGLITNDAVRNLGVTSLFGAALILAMKVEILHGPDEGSPIWPENITNTHIPNANAAADITHSEFEYLQLLHQKESILDGKAIGFHPCFFVPGDWRKDLSESECGVDPNGFSHPCNNKSDENVNIELWKLLFEKQLLTYKLQHPETYENYVNEVILHNFNAMIANPISKKKPGLVEALKSGMAEAQEIIGLVKNYKNNELDSKIENIKQKAERIITETECNYINKQQNSNTSIKSKI